MKIEGMEPLNKKPRGLSGSTIKIIAMISMLIDHIGATVVTQILVQNDANFDANGKLRMTGIVVLYWILRGIGRLAFPLFIFLLLEGFTYTRNRFRYIGRLFLFALVSEIPFDMAFNESPYWIRQGHILEFDSQNVFFTLAIGLCVITGLEGIRMLHIDAILKAIFEGGIVAVGAAVAYMLHTDYGQWGVLAICAAYLLRDMSGGVAVVADSRGCADGGAPVADDRGCADGGSPVVDDRGCADGEPTAVDERGYADGEPTPASDAHVQVSEMYPERSRKELRIAACCAVLVIMDWFEIFSGVDVGIVHAYNGQRGLRLKWVFYLFYPVHLLILAGICMILN